MIDQSRAIQIASHTSSRAQFLAANPTRADLMMVFAAMHEVIEGQRVRCERLETFRYAIKSELNLLEKVKP